MSTQPLPVTRESVRRLAHESARDPSTVIEVVHAAFNADRRTGGHAFVYDTTMLIHGFDGGHSRSVDPVDEGERSDKVEEYWRDAQHRARRIDPGELSVWHRAAIAALDQGRESVADLPEEDRRGVDEIARADYLLVLLRRFAREPTEESALRALASMDWLMGVPDDQRRAHPCPVCGRPAIGEPWHYVSVCDACHSRARCSHGRRVTGTNTSLSGGFEARHADDSSVCRELTRDGRCWIDDRPCRMGEAKFGGVFIGVAPLV
jgi:hypothetical protein